MVLVNPGLNDGVHRAGLFAETAVDALEEVDVVAGRAPGAVLADVGLDGDGERGADRFAKLARDAALLTAGVAPESVKPPESRRLGRLLFRVIDGDLLDEQVLEREPQPLAQFRHKKRLDQVSKHAYLP